MTTEKLFWQTERRKVKDLLPYDKNPRIISDKQMADLQRSLRKFNLAELPAINLDGQIVAGHQRIRALMLLGRSNEEIEVRVPSRQLTEQEFKDYMLTSNRSGGTWDWDILKINFDLGTLTTAGFDDVDLSKIFDEDIKLLEDDWNDEAEIKKIKHTDIKPGQMFALGRHRLICGSALDPQVVNRLMGDIKADLVDDDIPFNIDLSYDKGVGNKRNFGGTTNDSKTDEEYKIFVRTIIQNALAVTKLDAHIIFWCDERYVWLLQTLYNGLGINSKRLLIWIKDNASPTPTVSFNKVTEYAVYGTIGSPYLAKQVTNLNEIQNDGMTTGNNLHQEITDHLNIMLTKRLPSNQYDHPTQKDPSLHYKAIRRCTRVGGVVLDLTAGSGSILIACEQMQRTAYLCELEPIFCQVIINHYEKISGQKAALIK